MSIFGTQSEGDFATEVATAAAAETAEKPPAAAPEPATADVPAPEPAPAEASAEAEAEQDAAPEPKEKEPDRFVPLAALHKEREERQRLAQDFQNLTQAFQAFQQQLQQPQQHEQQPDPLDIDPNQEPFELINNLRNEVVQWRQARQAEQETTQIKSAYLGTIQQAVGADPTFKDAYRHLVQSRLNELTSMGVPPHQANETIKQEELNLARTSFTNGRNPADVIMGYAKARGFAPKQPEPAPTPPAEQVQQQAAKAAAATSISAGGKPPKNDLALADIANLSGAAFDAAWDKIARNAGKSNGLFRD